MSAPRVDPVIRNTNIIQELYKLSQIVPMKAENMWLQVLVTEKF